MYLRSNRCGNLVVELNRRALPLAADRVHDVEVDLWSVEGAVALVERVRLSDRVERALQLGLGVVPLLDRAEELGRPRRELHLRLHAEIAVDALDQAEHALDLVTNLRLHHEAVGIILAELPDARQSRQDA